MATTRVTKYATYDEPDGWFRKADAFRDWQSMISDLDEMIDVAVNLAPISVATSIATPLRAARALLRELSEGKGWS